MFICPCRRGPVLLVQPIWDIKGNLIQPTGIDRYHEENIVFLYTIDYNVGRSIFSIFFNQLLNLKYEIEEVCDNITITNIYQYTYSIFLLCIVWFFLNLFLGLYLYIYLKKKRLLES